MFQLDEKFLQDVGLADLPPDQKDAFLQHIYSELELRVGTKLSEGMNDDQLAQFEAFVDQDEQKVVAWFERYLPNYADAADFQSLKASAPADISPITLLSEYGSLKWLELNRPDYKQVVASELESLKTEILQNRDSILGTDTQRM
jgi:hypothetical protein